MNEIEVIIWDPARSGFTVPKKSLRIGECFGTTPAWGPIPGRSVDTLSKKEKSLGALGLSFSRVSGL